ncbi:MAG: catalase, partial [Chitinophagaceae bacterium]
LLDATKLVPEELVPVTRIGKMTLNRNPDNFFAETEQVAFHVGHVVPGIDFSNDPLLQGRLFSYTDTQLTRLGGPNFQEIPINRPIVPVHNNQRDGFARQAINTSRTSYHPNAIGGGCPFQAGRMQGGFASYPERIEAHKVRERSSSFFDFFSQAKLFYNSQSEPEKNHIIDALRFELGKVDTVAIRERMLGVLRHVDEDLAAQVAGALGLEVPEDIGLINQGIPADADPQSYQPVVKEGKLQKSAALSMAGYKLNTIATRKIAVLVTDGFEAKSLSSIHEKLKADGAVVELVSTHLGKIKPGSGDPVNVDRSLLTTPSVVYDAVYVAGGKESIAALAEDPDAIHFLNQAYRHCKPIAAHETAKPLLQKTYFADKLPAKSDNESAEKEGIVIGQDVSELFILAIKQHRFWTREKARKVPA